ncbi:MAG: hypothetical protein QOG69_1651 [Actinomycetota bacterium]|nr:hypothetical protein [Actinomycetota bacterium]
MRGDAFHERVAHNNAVFRRANESIKDTAEGYEIAGDLLPFLCECASERCTEIVQLSAAEYDSVRANLRTFLVVPGHESEDGEAAVVIERHDRYYVIEKVGKAGELVSQSLGAERSRDVG